MYSYISARLIFLKSQMTFKGSESGTTEYMNIHPSPFTVLATALPMNAIVKVFNFLGYLSVGYTNREEYTSIVE